MSAGGTRLVIDSHITAGCLYLIQILMVYTRYALLQPCLAITSVFATTVVSLQGTVLPHGVLVPTGKWCSPTSTDDV